MPEVFNNLDSGLVRGLQPGGKVDVRNLPKVFTRDAETEPPEYFTEYALARMLRTIDRIGVWLADQTRYVEEYNTSAEETAPNETFISVVADYEPASEMITEVLVTGPVNQAFTLTLGDRLLSLSTDATGKCLLSPTSFKLGPTAKRTVTSVPPPANPVPSQPAVPATGVAQQNLNAFPVQVVISPNGATITNVSVNGITVGTAAGTYAVPAFGAISIAYSVATPTWVWSNANPAPVTGAGNWFLHLSGHAMTSRRTA